MIYRNFVLYKLSLVVRLKLFKSFCSSMFGCELWPLQDASTDVFCVAWKKALRSIMGLPQNTRSYLLPIVSDSLQIFYEICKRSSRFLLSCLSSPSPLVRSLSWHSVAVAKYNSVL